MRSARAAQVSWLARMPTVSPCCWRMRTWRRNAASMRAPAPSMRVRGAFGA
nr:MAG TPA: hypothetical protein [Caudoviricetes sp.]